MGCVTGLPMSPGQRAIEGRRKTEQDKTTSKGLRIPEGYNARLAIKGHYKETAGSGGEIVSVML